MSDSKNGTNEHVWIVKTVLIITLDDVDFNEAKRACIRNMKAAKIKGELPNVIRSPGVDLRGVKEKKSLRKLYGPDVVTDSTLWRM